METGSAFPSKYSLQKDIPYIWERNNQQASTSK